MLYFRCLEYGLVKYGLITYADKFVIHFGIILIIALFVLIYGIKHVHLKFYEKGMVGISKDIQNIS